PSF
ncbi:Hypothetical protein EIN_192580, partial [Entamoeba invadens IP1]